MPQVAVVGCAHIHTPGFVKKLKERPDVQVKAVWDPSADRAKKRAEELGAPVVEDVNAIWANKDITAVVICSETNRHEELVLPGAKAKKHMFVEKPLGLGSKDAYRMMRAIEKAQVLFQTGYGQRCDPKNLFLREQIQKGSFGTITRARGSNCHGGSLKGWFDEKPQDRANEWRWMADPAIAGCGAYGDLGTHSLDLLMWLLGDVEAATACIEPGTARYANCDEFGEGLLKFKSGVVATLASSWVDVANPVSLILSGTEGHACVVSGQLYFQSAKVEGADGKQPWTNLPPARPSPLDLFLDAAGGKPDVPLVTVGEAAKRVAAMEALYAGAKTKKWVKPK